MTTSAPPAEYKRFVFDTVFDGDRVVTPPRPKRSYTADEVEAARAEGFKSGERSVTARAEAEAAAALSDIAATAHKALQALTLLAHDHRTAAADLALTAARKIADAALDQFPEAPAAAALSALARDLEATPRLMVHVAAHDAERLEAALTRAADQAGFPGQIILKPDNSLPRAAFIFDWGDGRAAFDPQAASERVESALKAALTAEGLHAEPLFPSTASEEA
jgi:flagellar assembly protein FliH